MPGVLLMVAGRGGKLPGFLPRQVLGAKTENVAARGQLADLNKFSAASFEDP